MNLLTLLSIGAGVLVFAACVAWYFVRAAAADDLGSISRNWITEHRNEHE